MRIAPPAVNHRSVAASINTRPNTIANKWSKLFDIRPHRTVQSYSPWGHIGTTCWTYAFFSPSESTTETANRSVQPFLHSSRQKVPILFNGRPFHPKPVPMGDLDLHLIRDSLGPSKLTTQTVSRSVQPFCRAHYCDTPRDRQTTLLGR